METKNFINKNLIRSIIGKRKSDTHKGDYGRILIIAGKKEMAGAAVLSGKAAIKSGSGLVHMCTDESIFPVIQISQPELICNTWEKAKENIEKFDAIAIGPGRGVSEETKNILSYLLTYFNKTLVIDADGLNTISKYKELHKMVKEYSGQIIFTPHTGESERLLDGMNLKGISKEETARMISEKYNCIAVIKGSGTFVKAPFSDGYTNTTGNPGMATAGSGDVLTGIITSFAGQNISPCDAALAGVFIHGLAGDKGAEYCGQYGLTAGNIADYVPFAIKEITK